MGKDLVDLEPKSSEWINPYPAKTKKITYNPKMGQKQPISMQLKKELIFCRLKIEKG